MASREAVGTARAAAREAAVFLQILMEGIKNIPRRLSRKHVGSYYFKVFCFVCQAE